MLASWCSPLAFKGRDRKQPLQASKNAHGKDIRGLWAIKHGVERDTRVCRDNRRKVGEDGDWAGSGSGRQRPWRGTGLWDAKYFSLGRAAVAGEPGVRAREGWLGGQRQTGLGCGRAG